MDTFLFKKADVAFKKLVSIFVTVTFILTFLPLPAALALRNPQSSDAPTIETGLNQEVKRAGAIGLSLGETMAQDAKKAEDQDLVSPTNKIGKQHI